MTIIDDKKISAEIREKGDPVVSKYLYKVNGKDAERILDIIKELISES